MSDFLENPDLIITYVFPLLTLSEVCSTSGTNTFFKLHVRRYCSNVYQILDPLPNQPFHFFHNLQRVFLSGPFSLLAELRNCTKLKEIYLSCNSSVKNLEFLPSGTTHVRVVDCPGLLSLHSSINSLEYLVVRSCFNIEDITGLGDLSVLHTLVLDNVFINNHHLNACSFPLLNKANLIRCGIRSLQWLQYSERLEYLSVNYNGKLTSLKGLEICTKLLEVNMANNNLYDVQSLTNFKYMYYLSLADNNITDLSPLAECCDLDTLFVNNNPIKDGWWVLYNFKKLHVLDLSCTTLAGTLPPFPALQGLKILRLENNPGLKNVENLKYALQLCYLNLGHCIGLDSGWDALVNCKDLRELDVRECQIGKSVLKNVLKECHNLESMNLSDPESTWEIFGRIPSPQFYKIGTECFFQFYVSLKP